MSSISVSCPQARRVKGRRKNLNKIWSGKEWKLKCKEFIGSKTCAWCGTSEHLLVHHPYLESYNGCYTDLELSGCMVLCSRCHFSLHHGLILCPVCKKHYFRVGGEMCKSCYLEKHPEIAEARAKYELEMKTRIKKSRANESDKRKALKQKHPCVSYRASGKCGKSMIGTRCTYSPTKALRDCGDSVAKKGVKV